MSELESAKYFIIPLKCLYITIHVDICLWMSPQNVSIAYSDLSKIGYLFVNVYGQRSFYWLSIQILRTHWIKQGKFISNNIYCIDLNEHTLQCKKQPCAKIIFWKITFRTLSIQYHSCNILGIFNIIAL